MLQFRLQIIVPKNQTLFSAPYKKVFNESIASLMALKWQISHSDQDGGLIQAKTPTSIWTLGDLITVHIVEESEEKVRVNVTSGSSQQYDWGKNKKNIELFYSELQARLNN